jgi:uncharacterized protein YukE
MGDLQVDYDRLSTSQTKLHALKQEFDNIDHRADMGTDVWSHSAVRSAMQEFGGNMDYNRKKLSERLQACGEKVENTLKTFRETDAKLAAELEKSRQS